MFLQIDKAIKDVAERQNQKREDFIKQSSMRNRMNNNLHQINNPEEINKNVISTEDNSSGSALQSKVTAANTDDANVLLDNGMAV